MKAQSSIPMPEIGQLRAELKRVRYRARYARKLRSTVGMLVVTAAAVILAATLWLPVLEIVGASMAPTVEEGDIILCVKDAQAQPGEMISFYVGNRLLVKRCIAGPGQWVDIDENGLVYVDGVLLEEGYIADPALGEGDVELPCQVPEGQLFCLGDNRAVSVDSRYTAVGCIPQEQIAGKLLLRVWPLTRFGLLE